MKKILGLDLGTNSIGWAVVKEKEKNDTEKSSIIRLGVRVNPLTIDESMNFEKGKSIPTNANRTLKRSMRRNLQRYKLRRDHLIFILKQHGFINDETILSEHGSGTTFETYRLRAKAATEEVSLSEFSRILLQINKKRGYKSSRKAKSTEEGQLIDGMEIAMKLHNEDITPGQLSLRLLQNGKKYLPEYYRSDLADEFNKVWNKQQLFYPEILTNQLKDELNGKNKSQTWAICAKPFMIVGIKRQTKGLEQKIETYQWRVSALSQKMELEKLAIVLQEINGQISSTSGYLGGISDRSKILYFNKQTVGQYLMSELQKNPNFSLKNKVFYRQDYLNEFETIWETQAKYHKELTSELKKDVRDVVIFYQRPLKSQKELISFCEFESKQITVNINGKLKKKTVGLRGCPKSSPLFQEFKIWQRLNDVVVSGKVIPVAQHDLFDTEVLFKDGKRPLFQEEKERLFEELSYKEKLSKTDVLKILFDKPKEYDMNFKMLDGNTTQAELFKAYQTIVEVTGYGTYDFAKMDANYVVNMVKEIFSGLGFNTDILTFDSSINGHAIEQQASYRLWHLLYSFEGDDSIMGNELLIKKISEQFGFDKECATILSDVVFKPDYASLSAKAIRKILPYLKDGNDYSVACEYAGYRHSERSLTKEEIENKVLKDKLDLLPRNSLRNPVVEKILNQMINVVNSVSATYGKPDEIRIELARELKKSAREREEMTKSISATTKLHEEYVKILKEAPFFLTHVSRNDIIRYKLYLELEKNGYKTLYSNTYIAKEKLFTKEFEIEHIVPKARLFDDSLSNKTLEARQVNLDKRDMTAYDFIEKNYGKEYAAKYACKIEDLFNNGSISKTKREKLLMKEADIPSGFINRDLRDSQYIAKKAREILEEYVPVVVPTTGSITDRLRDDWQLVNIMQELNWDKYNKLGMTEIEIGHDGQRIPRIKDWTKRNDHRHHAMDALTIAFTKHSYIQYLNNLNARVQKGVDDYIDLDKVNLATLDKEQRSEVMYAIEKKELQRDRHGRLRFIAPMPIDEFRAEARWHLEHILVSNKAKNKVTTRNTNVMKNKNGAKSATQLTPRGQLHLETVYGKRQLPVFREEKINASFDMSKILSVCKKAYREALIKRLHQFGDNPKKAFTGNNSLEKNPVWTNSEHPERVPETVKTITYEEIFTIRKEITPDLKIEKVIDSRIKEILLERLAQYKGDSKKAFSDLDKNPIWLNKEKGISIKRVTITGISNAIALHDKRDKDGNLIHDKDGKKLPTDFVSTGNNHHVAIYRKPKVDKNDKQVFGEDGEPLYELDEKVVSFFEATSRAGLGYPIIDKEYKKEDGWQFLFTMKQNEYFVFPKYDDNGKMIFNPLDYDEDWYRNPENYAVISPNLFRVQSMSKVMYGNSAVRDYIFRHHLETTVSSKLRGVTYQQFKTLTFTEHIVKVRIDHIGQIVSIGEY